MNLINNHYRSTIKNRLFNTLALLCFAFPVISQSQTTVHANVASIAGFQQTVVVGQPLAKAFVAKVTDDNGMPLAGVSVLFAIDPCIGFPEPPPGDPGCPPAAAYGVFPLNQQQITIVTDAAGQATAPVFIAGAVPAQYSVYAYVPMQQVNGKFIDAQFHVVLFQITQRSATSTIPLNPQMGGLYYDPNRNGEGWQLTFGTSNGQPTLVATWYTYDSGHPIWLFGSASYTASTTALNLQMMQTSGAHFGAAFNSAHVKTTLWGNATLQWYDCNTLKITYQRADGVSGVQNLTRFFYSAADAACP